MTSSSSTAVLIHPSTLPPRLRERVIEQRIFQQALTLAVTTREPGTLAEEAAQLRAIAANGLSAAEQVLAAGAGRPQDGIAQTAAIQALAATCGATVLSLCAQSLRDGGDPRVLDSIRALTPTR